MQKCSAEVVVAREIFAFLLGVDPKVTDRPTPLINDNLIAVRLSHDDCSAKGAKAVVRHRAILRELVEDKVLITAFVNSGANMADCFTKPMPAAHFHYWRRFLVT